MEPLRDDLTGAFSWEAFADFATLAVGETRRREGALSLLLVAIDGLGYGRSVDETALRLVCNVLTSTVRTGDMVGRSGPQSFVVLAQAAQTAGAQRLAERLRFAMPGVLPVANHSIPLTISIGIASMPQAGATMTELLQRAGEALSAATAAGGNSVRVAPVAGATGATVEAPAAPPAVPSLEKQEGYVDQQRAVLAQLSQAWERQEIDGVVIQTKPSACPVCLDAGRDIYLPRWAPPLPLIGCQGPVGCRCVYAAAPPDPRRRPPPVPAHAYPNFEVPRKYRDAAGFGADPRRSCKPEDLAEYIDLYPLLPFEVELELHAGEVAYLVRPAMRAWERMTAVSASTHGPQLPREGSFAAWAKRVGRAPALPSDGIPFQEDGFLYLTNWRIMFSKRDGVDSVLLADVAAIEYLRDGLACIVGDRSNRLVFLLRDPLQACLYIAKAVRDVLGG